MRVVRKHFVGHGAVVLVLLHSSKIIIHECAHRAISEVFLSDPSEASHLIFVEVQGNEIAPD